MTVSRIFGDFRVTHPARSENKPPYRILEITIPTKGGGAIERAAKSPNMDKADARCAPGRLLYFPMTNVVEPTPATARLSAIKRRLAAPVARRFA